MYLSEVRAGKKLRKRRFYSPYLGEAPTSPSRALTIDLARAAAKNRDYAQRLGWGSQFKRIVALLGFRDYSPDESTFIQAVARWQASRPGLVPDGIIGPKTWQAMRGFLLPVSTGASNLAPAPAQAASPDAAFVERVLQGHIARSTKSKGQPQPDLRSDQLGPVSGTQIEMRADAATAASQMLAQANQDLAAAKSARDPDALRTVRLSATSGYRGRAHQERLWRGAFPGYYSETASKRASLPGGPHGDAAVQLMVKAMSPFIAAPGFSNHQAGVAIDLWQQRVPGSEIHNSRKKLWRDKWESSWFFHWLQSNAARFGFRPYPVEPWHWEYRP